MPSLRNKYPAFVFLIYLLPLILSTTPSYSSSFYLVWHFLCFATMVHFISLISHIYCRDPPHSSTSSHLTCVVSQVSVLGPVLFHLYTNPLSSLISASSISHLLYADDTQLFVLFVPKNFSSVINNLQSTITLISSWISSNDLTLNSSKTEFLLISLPQQTSQIVNPFSLSLPPNP